MAEQLNSQYVKNDYNEFIKTLSNKEYIEYRWKNKTKMHEYDQTKLSLIEELKKSKHLKNILEIGCGPGTWTNMLAEKCDTLTAIDISEKMLEIAKVEIRNKNVQIICGDFLSDTLKDEKFDAIYTVRAFEYFDDKIKSIKKIKRSLNNHGRICIITKNPDYLPKKISDNIRRFEQLKGILPEFVKKGMDVYSKKLHSDMINFKDLEKILKKEGFKNIGMYPVIIGIFPSHLSGAVSEKIYEFFDWIHQKFYRRPMNRLLSPLVESYIIIGINNEE